MRFEWIPIAKHNSAGLLLAEKLCKSGMTIEDQLREWLSDNRSLLICCGETSGVRKPSVCLIYVENGVELGEAEILLSEFLRYYPHVAPVTSAFGDEDEISRFCEESKDWFKERDQRAGVFWDGDFCVDRADLSGALDIALSYATAYVGEASFHVRKEEDLEWFVEAIDPAIHPEGRILSVGCSFNEPISGKGFGESVTVFMDDESGLSSIGSGTDLGSSVMSH